MKKKINISIESPCGEDYKKFKSTSLGGYCQSCKKEVVDFTDFEKSALYSYFDSQTGKVCGKFHLEQLGRISQSQSTSSVSSKLFAATLSLLTLTGSKEAISNNLEIRPNISSVASSDLKVQYSSSKLHDGEETEITGVIIDSQDKSPLPGATIVVKGTEKGSQTDIDGKFTILLSKEELSNSILVFSYLGYETKEIEAALIGSEPVSMEL